MGPLSPPWRTLLCPSRGLNQLILSHTEWRQKSRGQLLSSITAAVGLREQGAALSPSQFWKSSVHSLSPADNTSTGHFLSTLASTVTCARPLSTACQHSGLSLEATPVHRCQAEPVWATVTACPLSGLCGPLLSSFCPFGQACTGHFLSTACPSWRGSPLGCLPVPAC